MVKFTRTQRQRWRLLPGLQRSLCLQFAGLALLALCAQFVYLSARVLSLAARESETPDESIIDALPGILVETFSVSLLLFGPLLLGLAIVLTRRFAGPLHGLEGYLRRCASEGVVRPFQTRPNDKIDGLRDAVNAALSRASSGAASSKSTSEEQDLAA